ncbi:proline-rich protein HaeIII subfamily 1-like [Diceros bicornis minor]|uniref:proline-rich protein HaeIII subfamily 1-like n=1 Tax=Diceros bicornis minor TaxID=77932 RepID=UPI0026EF8AEA|nr:proline-rich protein HaeIII subfamily 1-like [Diceros bicornis minor]
MAGAPGQREAQGAAGPGHPAARRSPAAARRLLAAAPHPRPPQRPPGPGPPRSGRRLRVAGARGAREGRARVGETEAGGASGRARGGRGSRGGRGQARPLTLFLAFPLCPRPSPPRHKDPGPPGEGRVTEPPAGGVAATPPRAHPRRPRRQPRPRPRPAPPPGELLFLRRGGSAEAGGRGRPSVQPRWAGGRRGCSADLTLTDTSAALCKRFSSISFAQQPG